MHDQGDEVDRVGGAEGLALFRLQVHKADLPRRRVCQDWTVRAGRRVSGAGGPAMR